MQSKTEQIFGTLEVLVESLPCISLPGHEHGGYIYPFVWEASKNREFNVLNFSLSKGWLKLTDYDADLKNWQEMSYLKSFNRFLLNIDQEAKRLKSITVLFQILNQRLQNLDFFSLKTSSHNDYMGLFVGKTTDGDWICACHTIYKETKISQITIRRTEQNHSIYNQSIGENTLNLISEIEVIISELGTIKLEGDFGGGYYYSYEHKFVYAVAKTKEQAIEKALQASGMLEVGIFHSFYPHNQYFEDEYNRPKYNQYNRVNQFFAQNFSDTMMYRFSFWTEENIYIIATTQSGDRAGISIHSDFGYNP